MEFRRLKSIIIVVMFISHQMIFWESMGIGVNYGLNGDNLPPPSVVINLIKSKGIDRIRIFEPNVEVLAALRGSGIYVCMGTRNEDLPNLASSQEAASYWINQYVLPYYDTILILIIIAGNEVIPGEYASYVVPALRNLRAALYAVGLTKNLLTTVVSTKVLIPSYPPSQTYFKDQNMVDVVNWLWLEGLPLMANIYPYFALVSDPSHISLDYALLNSNTPTFMDGNLTYYNLFDVIFDSFLAAAEKAWVPDLALFVSETGWPNAGDGGYATTENARICNNNLKKHTYDGTPKYRGAIDVYFFALFNENLKPFGVEQHWGCFYPTMEPVYALF